MSLSKRHSFIHLIPLAVTLILFTCQKQVFDNPHDATSAIDPSSWAPSNLQAQVLADSTIKLTWKHEAENIEGFKIDRQVGSLAWMQEYAILAKTDREWIDTNKVFDTTLTYRLYAYASSNYSAYDSITSFIQSVRGCTDSDAANYNPEAQVDDGSCIYPLIVISPKGGEEWEIGSEQTITWERNDLSRMIGGDFDLPQNKLITKKKRAGKKSKTVINRQKNPQVPIMKGNKKPTMARSNIKGKIQELNGTMPLTVDTKSGKVKIELYADGTVYAIIKNSTDDDGSYSWMITPDTYSGGSTFKIRITDIVDTSVYAESENYFTLIEIPGCTDSHASNYDITATIDDDSCTYDTPTEGLVAWYPFNGNAEDASGNGNDGDINEGTDSEATLTTDRFGNDNSAYSFDGVDDFVALTSPFNTVDDLDGTLCVWFNTLQQSAGWIIGQDFSGSNRDWWFTSNRNNAGRLVFMIDDTADNNREVESDPGNDLSDGQWHQVCGLWGDTGMSMYIDGTLQSNTNAYDIYPNTAVASYIGCYRGGTYPSGTSCNGNFDGKVDDIHIYKRALNEAEISKLYCDGGWCIEGCTDINATNYNANANIDDGSCTYDTPTEGLVAYYPFTGNAEDASGNGNDGDINEGTDSGPTLTTDRFGNDNSAYSFDGSNDFIEVQHSNALNIFEADFTITLFFNTNQNETDHTKLLFDKRMNDGSSAIAIGNSNGNLSFHLEDETHYYQIYSEPISDGEWHFAVLLRTVNQMQMSIDGDWINESVNISDLENINNIGDMKIGARFDETEFYQGYMDELRIYNHALTEAEIEDLYCGGGWCVGNCTDPLADNYSEGAEIDDGSCSGSPVNAVDFTYSGEFDGHYYYLSNYTANWNDAKTISENSSGHLVTISTEEENMFVSNLENAVLWIGLTDEVEENNWVWVTDEPFQYTNWKTNEPNDGSGNEDYVMTNYNFTIEGLGFWNDYNGDDQNKFVLEIEKGCTDINATNYNANANIDDGTCEFITNGLVTYYPFEKTSMNSLLLDGLKGVEGVIGGSIEFDGSNNMRVFNEVSPNGTDFSFFTWINFHELETEYIIGDRKENSNVGWFIYTYSDGNLQFGYKGDILVNCYVTTTIGNVISINNWYHLGFVINTQNNEMIAYVNGIIVGNFIDNHCNSVGINHDDLLIGHSHEGGYLMGKIDEFVVYNNALGNNNVIELYNNGAGKRVDETTFGMTNVIYYNDMDVLTDMSGNGNNGTANGNPTQTATGYNETSNKSAMEFDGIDDKVCIDLYNAEQNTGTISVWFKSEDSSSEIMGQDANGWNNLDTNFGIGIQNASCGTENKLTFSTHGPVTSDVRCVSSTTSVNDNNWHHGVAVVTGSQYQIWVDGVNEANISTDYGIWGANGSTELCFPEDANYNGKLDEVRIYNHALSASEIQALYQQ